mmetsp:Transcript_5844/g.22885  ORF Transcript_5844/g.22885 Transcript_5844/m.22885 type:complete len:339 (+) Transcript_5844:3134-4150(+)
MAGAGDDPHGDAVALELGHFGAGDVAVPGLAHLVAGGQVEPELEAGHAACVLLGGLAVDHAAASGHPLHAAVADQAFMAGRVAVAHAAVQHVGDGLETAVRVVGEAGDVVVRVVRAEVVEHQEGVEAALQVLRQHPVQLDAGTVAGRLTGDEALDLTRLVQQGGGNGAHGDLSSSQQFLDLGAGAGQALFGGEGHTLGVDELDIAHAEEGQHGAQIGRHLVAGLVAVDAAAAGDDVDLLAGEQADRALLGVLEGDAGAGHRVDPVLELGRDVEVVHRHADDDRVGGLEFGDQRVIQRDAGGLLRRALGGRREQRAQGGFVEQGLGRHGQVAHGQRGVG